MDSQCHAETVFMIPGLAVLIRPCHVTRSGPAADAIKLPIFRGDDMNSKEQWKLLANELGFTYKEGIDAFVESPTLARMAASQIGAGDFEKAKAMLSNPLVKGLLDSLFIGTITGKTGAYECTLFRGSASSSQSGSSSGKVYYVNIALLFRQSLDWGLDMYRAGLSAKIAKKLFRKNYVPVPDDGELERMIAVRAKKRDQVQLFLRNMAVSDQLKKLFSSPGDYHISDHGIRYKLRGEIIAKDEALRVLAILAETAVLFGK